MIRDIPEDFYDLSSPWFKEMFRIIDRLAELDAIADEHMHKVTLDIRGTAITKQTMGRAEFAKYIEIIERSKSNGNG